MRFEWHGTPRLAFEADGRTYICDVGVTRRTTDIFCDGVALDVVDICTLRDGGTQVVRTSDGVLVLGTRFNAPRSVEWNNTKVDAWSWLKDDHDARHTSSVLGEAQQAVELPSGLQSTCVGIGDPRRTVRGVTTRRLAEDDLLLTVLTEQCRQAMDDALVQLRTPESAVLQQSEAIRADNPGMLNAALVDPYGRYHESKCAITRTIELENGALMAIGNSSRRFRTSIRPSDLHQVTALVVDYAFAQPYWPS